MSKSLSMCTAHNDFGLAGSEQSRGCRSRSKPGTGHYINGLGERAGNADLAEDCYGAAFTIWRKDNINTQYIVETHILWKG